MEDTVNAFVSIFEVAGATDGPLSGLTFGAKDLYDVAGHVTGCGNPDWARTHDVADTHAPPVSALLDAGARLVGKTHTDELAYSLMGVNEQLGTPVNFAAPDRVPGGSSSGSVAAVAAGLVDIGLGSDTGGSVRMPASFCGVYGIRTTHGRIPIDRTMPLAPSFDTAGWFTRDTATLALAAQAFGIGSGTLPKKLLLPVDAWARAWPQTVAAMAQMMAKLQDLCGPAEPVLLAPEGLTDWREAFRMHQGREVWQVHGDWITTTQPNFGAGIDARFQMARGITDEEFAWARDLRVGISDRVQGLLADGAVMVLPTSPGPAPLRKSEQAEQDDFRARALEMLCPAGHAGCPQISIPAGAVDSGPVGLSLIGPRNGEEMLLELAVALG
ncbi:MAG: amidase [Pseudomonadota bacterium]